MEKFTKAVQKRVDHFRSKGESMDDISRRAGISRVYLYDVLKGKHSPSVAVAERMASGLGIKISVK